MNKFSSISNQTILLIGISLITLSPNAFASTKTSFLSENTIAFKNSWYESQFLNNKKIILRSNEGDVNLDYQEINLIGDVQGKFYFDGESYFIKAPSLRANLSNNSILSNEKVIFETKGLQIVSSGIEFNQVTHEGLMILFANANLNIINLGSKALKGKANKIKLLPLKNIISMEGNAEFIEGTMKIISDEILYDLTEDRIIKSLNAKIIKNL